MNLLRADEGPLVVIVYGYIYLSYGCTYKLRYTNEDFRYFTPRIRHPDSSTATQCYARGKGAQVHTRNTWGPGMAPPTATQRYARGEERSCTQGTRGDKERARICSGADGDVSLASRLAASLGGRPAGGCMPPFLNLPCRCGKVRARTDRQQVAARPACLPNPRFVIGRGRCVVVSLRLPVWNRPWAMVLIQM